MGQLNPRTGKRRGFPTCEEIADAQVALLVTFRNLAGKPPASACWACGDDEPERAHILARKNGGGNEPDNFLLLCHDCHLDQPDGAPRALQIEWAQGRLSREVIDQAKAHERALAYLNPLFAEADRLRARDLLEPEFANLLKTAGLATIFDEADQRAARGNRVGFRANRIAYLIELFRAWVEGRRRRSAIGVEA